MFYIMCISGIDEKVYIKEQASSHVTTGLAALRSAKKIQALALETHTDVHRIALHREDIEIVCKSWQQRLHSTRERHK
jgi:hypothetical protein